MPLLDDIWEIRMQFKSKFCWIVIIDFISEENPFLFFFVSFRNEKWIETTFD